MYDENLYRLALLIAPIFSHCDEGDSLPALRNKLSDLRGLLDSEIA